MAASMMSRSASTPQPMATTGGSFRLRPSAMGTLVANPASGLTKAPAL